MKAAKKELSIDRAGRVVLPQALRRHFHLVPGSVVEVEVQTEAILLKPQVRHAALSHEHGLLVHEGRSEGDLAAAMDDVRQERNRQVSGGL